MTILEAANMLLAAIEEGTPPTTELVLYEPGYDGYFPVQGWAMAGPDEDDPYHTGIDGLTLYTTHHG